MPPPRTRRRGGLPRSVRLGLIIAGVVLFVLFVSSWGLAGLYTDYLWYDALDQEGVWSRIFLTKLSLAGVFCGLFFAGMWLNLFVADRIAPVFRPSGPEELVLQRYHDAVAGREVLVRSAVAVVLALIVGAAASSQWQSWMLFTNAVDFDIDDPQFGRDIGFYVFRLPFWSFVVDWAFRAVLLMVVFTAAAHYVNGGIRFQTSGQIVRPAVKAHLSVLLALLAGIKAVDYYFDRFDLTVSTEGFVDGATATDVDAKLPALTLLLLIAVLAFVVFLVNIRRRGWVFPAAVVVLWTLAALVMGEIYPAIYQRLRVEPAESAREAVYIERNIDATRDAYGLDVSVEAFPYDPSLDATDIVDAEGTIRNIRLLDPSIVQDTFERLEAERAFYEFVDLDVDRYQIDGRTTQVVIGARTVQPSDITEPSWDNETLGFTHGYGVALSPANGVDSSGRPDFLVEGVPPQNRLDVPLDQPQLYVGEGLGGYAIVGTERNEIDYVSDAGEEVTFRYDGDGGVRLGGFFRRLAFSMRFGDINPLVSGQLNSDSRVLYNRDIRDRLETLAPFLHFDNDPYPVIHDGRIVYMADAYTTTDRYPYSQRADTDSVPRTSGLAHGFNYVRASVKAVVDGYDGSVTMYVVDPTDPIISAWRGAFPDLFEDFDDMPSELVEHVRYPEDLFRVQTNMWARYHEADPVAFYGRSNWWEVAQDPGQDVRGLTRTTTTATTGTPDPTLPTDQGRIDPHYVLLRLPGEANEEFVILRSFVPFSGDSPRPELTAFMVARSDPENYGQLVAYEMPGTEVDGPLNVNSNILTEETIADRITQLNQQGSQVRLANMLLLPIANSIVYVRPLYVQADDEAARIPELKAVIVAHDDDVVIDATLQGALEQLFGVAPDTLQEEPDDPIAGSDDDPDDDDAPAEDPADDDPGDDDPLEVPDDVAALLDAAAQLFDEADDALRDGDLGQYQAKTAEASRLIDRAVALLEPADDAGVGGAATEPTPVATPEPEPA